MLSTSKILPIIPNTTKTLNKEFLLRYPKFSRHLDFEYNYKNLAHNPSQKSLLKAFQTLKFTKKIHQKGRLPPSKDKYLSKKAQRLKIISISDDPAQNQAPARLDGWLKYAKNLQGIKYLFLAQSATNQTKLLFQKQIHHCFRWLPRTLQSFHIKLPPSNFQASNSFSKYQRHFMSDLDVLNLLLRYRKYPVSLKKFALEQEGGEPKFTSYAYEIYAFSRLKNLCSLSFSGPMLGRLVEVLLERVPGLLQNLRSLDVKIPKSFSVKSYYFSLNFCQKLENLKCLKVSNISESKPLDVLSWTPPLEALTVQGNLGIRGLGMITWLLYLLKNSLKTLRIDVFHDYRDESPGKIKDLLRRIGELQVLTHFQFNFRNSNGKFNNFSGMQISSDIFGNLEGVLSKPLRSFEWYFPRKSSQVALTDFLILLSLLEGSLSTLRKLKIFSEDPIDFHPALEGRLINFLKRLESIEVLHLTGFDFMKGSFGENVVGSLEEVRFLKSLWLGSIQMKNWRNASLKKDFVKAQTKEKSNPHRIILDTGEILFLNWEG